MSEQSVFAKLPRKKVFILVMSVVVFFIIGYLLFVFVKNGAVQREGEAKPQSNLTVGSRAVDGNEQEELGILEETEIDTIDTVEVSELTESTTRRETTETVTLSEKITTSNKQKSFNGYFTNFSSLVSTFLHGSFLVAVLLSLLYIVWGGIDWITSGGEKEKINAAVRKIVAAVVGLIIVSSSYAIVSFLLYFLGIESLNGLLRLV